MCFDLSPPGQFRKIDHGSKGATSVLTITLDDRANEFKYINHSCTPNSLICAIYSHEYGAHLHGVSAFARRTINAYSEITFDYYKPKDYFRFDCACGGYACRGIKGGDIA
ncbi:hypothetical protein PFISCL1PPCAC_26420 [Pristionchus fissidentatus]|uniref:SET domain-containing protein n=1 Tax=Pristionchus fissidentatus TaxID=1538716 RepID=A0AAV5WWR1_9BILA|nr:hypothetical protein PFISCL1PPCAC_26420 [Pristionchus fissidentatus]